MNSVRNYYNPVPEENALFVQVKIKEGEVRQKMSKVYEVVLIYRQAP